MNERRSNSYEKKERLRTFRRSKIVKVPWPREQNSEASNPVLQNIDGSKRYLIKKKKPDAAVETSAQLIDMNTRKMKKDSEDKEREPSMVEGSVVRPETRGKLEEQENEEKLVKLEKLEPPISPVKPTRQHIQNEVTKEDKTESSDELDEWFADTRTSPSEAPEVSAPAPGGQPSAAARYIWRRGSGPRRPNRRRFAPAAGLAGLALTALLIPAVLAWPREGTPPQPAPAAEQTAPPAAGESTGLGGEAAPEEAAAPPASSAQDTPPAPQQPAVVYPEPEVRVYLAETGTIDTVTLEQYVTGVLAAEMPSDFGLEALKAQAIAARTFIVKRLAAHDTSGVPASGADVTDTVDHQVYHPYEGLQEEWKAAGKEEEWAKLEQAIRESKDTIMTYHGEPITASFFSTSNGYTENSEDVWQQELPYLRSVSSPWDAKIAPGFKESITMSRAEFMNKLNVVPEATPVSTNNEGAQPFIEVISKTDGNRIKEIRVGSKRFSGKDIRELLGLRSSEFTWSTKGSDITITTLGYGHGVGMSQWGANGMAQEGYTATEILKHYYTGISFGQASKLLYKEKS